MDYQGPYRPALEDNGLNYHQACHLIAGENALNGSQPPRTSLKSEEYRCRHVQSSWFGRRGVGDAT